MNLENEGKLPISRRAKSQSAPATGSCGLDETYQRAKRDQINTGWILLYGSALVAEPSLAANEVYTLTLDDGLPHGRALELFLSVGSGRAEGAFALRPQFNRVSYTVDASEFKPAKGRLAGRVETVLEGRPCKKNTAFMGSLPPVEEAAQ